MLSCADKETLDAIETGLKTCLKYGIIPNEAGIAELNIMKKLNAMIESHHVWQGKDGKWHTYFKTEDKRIKKTRTTYEALMNDVKDFYMKMEDNPTIKELFEEWLAPKLKREEIINSTADRYRRNFDRSFGPIKDKRIRSFREYDIEQFVLDAIYVEGLTRKAYEGFRTILYGIFDTARKKGYVTFFIQALLGDIKIPKKAFAVSDIDEDKLRFTDEEIRLMEEEIKDDPDILNLGIALNFRIGLRIGELSGLKWQDVDIKHKVIHVCRTETSYNDSETGKHIYEVREGAKTDAGVRDVILADSAVAIIKAIRRINPFAEYVFMRDGRRVRTYVFRQRIYRLCQKAGFGKKQSHSVRRTVATQMIDAHLKPAIITSQLGHLDYYGTTLDFYYKDRSTPQERQKAVNSVFG